MIKYLISFFFVTIFFVSCSKETPVLQQEQISLTATQGILPEGKKAIVVTGAIDDTSTQIFLEKQQEQIEKTRVFLETDLAECDSENTQKTAEEILKSQNITDERLERLLKTAPERCKIRAIIRNNLECSLLVEEEIIKKCEYAQEAVRTIRDFQEKQATYNKLFGNIDQSTQKAVPELLSDWW